MKKTLQWYIEVWVDGIENYEKNRHKHLGYLERTLMLLLASSWLRSLAISLILVHTKYKSSAFIVLIALFVFILMYDYFILFYKKKYIKYQQSRTIRTNGKMFNYIFIGIPVLLSMASLLILFLEINH